MFGYRITVCVLVTDQYLTDLWAANPKPRSIPILGPHIATAGYVASRDPFAVFGKGAYTYNSLQSLLNRNLGGWIGYNDKRINTVFEWEASDVFPSKHVQCDVKTVARV